MVFLSIGNSILAQIRLIKSDKFREDYHLNNGDNKLCIDKVQIINGNTITWFIPKNVFDTHEHEERVKFQIDTISENESLLILKKKCCCKNSDKYYADDIENDSEINIVINGQDSIYSWGNRGGDLCIVNPKSKASTYISEYNQHAVGELYIATFGKSEASSKPIFKSSRTQCDGNSSAHFATYGKSSQHFKSAHFEKDQKTAVYTIFRFVVDDEE